MSLATADMNSPSNPLRQSELHSKQPTSVGIPQILIMSISLFIDFCLDKAIAPFSIFFSREMNLTFEQFGYIVAVSSFGCVFSLFVTPLLRRIEVNRAMFILQFIACLLTIGYVLPVPFRFMWLMIVRFAYGISVCSLFTWGQSVVSNFSSDRVRNRGNAIVESAWALGSAGYIIVGYILKTLGWKYVFLLLGLSQLPGAIILLYSLPRESMQQRSEFESQFIQKPDIRTKLKQKSSDSSILSPQASYCEILCHVFTNSQCIMCFLGAFFLCLVNNALATLLGAWFEWSFGMDEVQTGKTSLSLGIGEVIGVWICILFDDFLPDKRLVCFVSIVGGTLMFWSLWIFSQLGFLGLKISIGLLFSYAITLEICFASIMMIPKLITHDPVIVSVTQSGIITMSSTGGLIGSALGPHLWFFGRVGGTFFCLSVMMSLSTIAFAILLAMDRCSSRRFKESDGRLFHEYGIQK